MTRGGPSSRDGGESRSGHPLSVPEHPATAPAAGQEIPVRPAYVRSAITAAVNSTSWARGVLIMVGVAVAFAGSTAPAGAAPDAPTELWKSLPATISAEQERRALPDPTPVDAVIGRLKTFCQIRDRQSFIAEGRDPRLIRIDRDGSAIRARMSMWTFRSNASLITKGAYTLQEPPLVEVECPAMFPQQRYATPFARIGGKYRQVGPRQKVRIPPREPVVFRSQYRYKDGPWDVVTNRLRFSRQVPRSARLAVEVEHRTDYGTCRNSAVELLSRSGRRFHSKVPSGQAVGVTRGRLGCGTPGGRERPRG